MKRVFLIIVFMVILLPGYGRDGASFSTKNEQISLRLDNNIQLIIDERLELVCTVFRLAGAQEYINYQLYDYISEVDSFVRDSRNHPIVSFIKEIREKFNFAYSIAAKSALMVSPYLFSFI